jgi:D-glycerate 3-kinase
MRRGLDAGDILMRLGRPDPRQLRQVRDLCAALPADPEPAWRPLAAALCVHWQSLQRWPRLVAISGGQGAGKSTVAALLGGAMQLLGTAPNPCVCSLDDFYLRRAERQRMAAKVHPLFTTRGVPGTHDIELLGRCLGALRRGGPVELPVFDKGVDDRVGTRVVQGPFETVILEGWVLGARAQPPGALALPVNTLERIEDPDGAWRRIVNAELAGAYARLNARMDFLLFLGVPDMLAVRAWRDRQQRSLASAQRMDAAQLAVFVAHFERLTRWMRLDVPRFASVSVELGRNHAIERVLARGTVGLAGRAGAAVH